MYSLLKSASNPKTMLQNMISSNPQMRQVVDLINEAGGNPKDAFYSLARKKGVNPDDILNMLK